MIATLSACSEIETECAGEIMMQASINDISVSTKADEPESIFKGAAPSSGNKLPVDLWISATSGVYTHNPAEVTMFPCSTKIEYDSPTPDYPDPIGENKIKYNRDDSWAYCVGFYPQGKWSVIETIATAEIDGKTDLMFAPQISGKWTMPFEEQTYSHLLTWLKVCICATDTEAVSAWGDIDDISVITDNDYPIYSSVTADLGTGQTEYSGASQPLHFFADDVALETVIKETGSVLCSPSSKYRLKVRTLSGKEKTILINLKDLAGNEINSNVDAAGKMFVITLYFNPFDVIEGICTLNSWNNEDEELELE